MEHHRNMKKKISLVMFMAACCAIAIACTPQSEDSSTETKAPQPTQESQASKEFYAAMEKGEFKRGKDILEKEIAAHGPKPEYLYNLGLIYQRGAGVPVDLEKAAGWYLKASDMGDSESQYNLGTLHENGQGVQKSVSQATKYYRLSAVQNYAPAQYNLARLYALEDKAIPAYVWLSIAAQGSGEAKARSERTLARIKSKLTEAEISEAEHHLRRCSSSLNTCPN